jgi:putative Mg2+ transporter-C (MgtC) family protein
MNTHWTDWLGDIHVVVPGLWVGVIVTIAAVLCGGVVGLERAMSQKPVGMRTLILICLGSAIFTQASILMAGGIEDRTRIAAQIVTGIGFLGAGAIMHERGLIIGITTGAGIWAVAAVGVILGSGYVAAGFFFMLLILGTLAGSRLIDRMVTGPCADGMLTLVADPLAGRMRFAIQAILDEYQHEGNVRFDDQDPGMLRVEIQYCRSHRAHRTFLGPLMDLPGIREVRHG